MRYLKRIKLPFVNLFIEHRNYFFLNGQSLEGEAQHLIDAFTQKEISQIAGMAQNEAFYTLLNLLNARMRMKREDFEKYPDDLWKIIQIISHKEKTLQ